MADCRITHIRKPDRFSPHEHITHVGNVSTSGNTSTVNWIWTREKVISSIEEKSNTFFVKDVISGKRSEVGVIYPGEGRLPYLRTYADGDWNNNLLSLPQC